jgi:hypothetical protein
VAEQVNDDRDDGGGHGDDQVLKSWKKRKKNKIGSRQRYI